MVKGCGGGRGNGTRDGCAGHNAIDPGGQVQRVPLRVIMHVGDLRDLTREMIVDGRYRDPLICELYEYGLELAAREHEVAHHRRIALIAREAGPGTERDRRGDRHITNPEREITARPGVAVVSVSRPTGGTQNLADRIPGSTQRRLARRWEGNAR